jgi:hypothetical protein
MTSGSRDTDDLLRRALAGDNEALAPLFDHYRERLRQMGDFLKPQHSVRTFVTAAGEQHCRQARGCRPLKSPPEQGIVDRTQPVFPVPR